ncbi:hypothetical protein BKH41_09050 [Helicobacter sp. 12S02232-10]|uniref:ABC transporter ATP-binding protein n=1 Tax=Helicobacter sp. 12S02232-10 TaxID=1476197 RepID=UPI000BA6ADB8|nr:ABC transporter ATP-binding protein [Helicobacter sp. 12S02232-10]PAF46481.1 hypothetical protein BKH41_09050 [Helicobacter sp. 12S02232-10]
MSLFSVRNGGFYRKNKRILEDLNLDLNAGEILCVLGCNGIGKTTFLKCCMGFLEWSNGESLLFGQNIVSMRDFWKKVSYVPQAKNMHMGIKVVDMVLLGCNPILQFRPKKQHLNKAMETLEDLGILHLAHSYCHLLSGGELQMVLFARALVSDPLLLVLDEPESNLDMKNQLVILDLLKKLSSKGVSVLLNTHYINHAFKISQKCLLLYREKHIPKHIYGNMSEVLKIDYLSKIFDVPLAAFEDNYFDFGIKT